MVGIDGRPRRLWVNGWGGTSEVDVVCGVECYGGVGYAWLGCRWGERGWRRGGGGIGLMRGGAEG